MNGSSLPGPKYEFKPFRYSSHYWILKLLEAEKEPLEILDVGTASGYLGKTLRERGHSVTGIEMDPATAEKARAYYDFFHVADLETFEFPYRREFDYILFADVLEHLRDPAAVLRRCIPALKESGKIIISVPNVANIVVRLSLLLGRFDYMDRGILDRTHFRFFYAAKPEGNDERYFMQRLDRDSHSTSGAARISVHRKQFVCSAP